MSEINEIECRICFERDTDIPRDCLISPCKCKGTSEFVHKSCLDKWRMTNREGEAWRKCMECHTPYEFTNAYSLESTTLLTYNSLISIYLLQYICGLFFSFVIWIVDAYNNYESIRLLNYNITMPEPSLLTFVKNDSAAPQIYYASLYMFIQNIVIYLYFCYIMIFNIKRKSFYISKIYKTFLGTLLLSMQFIIYYYLFAFNNSPLLFLNFSTFSVIINPLYYYRLVQKHNLIIREINETNEVEIVSYTYNPVYNRIFDDSMGETKSSNYVISVEIELDETKNEEAN